MEAKTKKITSRIDMHGGKRDISWERLTAAEESRTQSGPETGGTSLTIYLRPGTIQS